MNTKDRYLNVQYGTLIAEVNITGISRLGGVRRAIKVDLGEAIPVAPAFIQLYTNSTREQLINTWAFFNSLPQEYFTEGGSCVVIGTSPPPSRQPTQTDLGSTFAAASPALLNFWTAFTNYSNPLEENTVVQLPENVFILFCLLDLIIVNDNIPLFRTAAQIPPDPAIRCGSGHDDSDGSPDLREGPQTLLARQPCPLRPLRRQF